MYYTPGRATGDALVDSVVVYTRLIGFRDTQLSQYPRQRKAIIAELAKYVPGCGVFHTARS